MKTRTSTHMPHFSDSVTFFDRQMERLTNKSQSK